MPRRCWRGQGAEIVINGRDTEALGLAAEKLASGGAKVKAVAFDVTNEDSVADGIGHIEAALGPIDILVNNAGMQFRSPLEDFPVEKFEQVMRRTNVTSVFTVGQAVARKMIPRGHGKIINICSVMSNVARPSIAPYAASKAAVANLTRGMATDWAKYGLNINGGSRQPGYIRTELNEALLKNVEFNAWGWKSAPSPAAGLAEPGELRRRRYLSLVRCSEFRQWPHPLRRRRLHRHRLKARASSS